MHTVFEQPLESVADASRRTAHSAWNVDYHRMIGIDSDALFLELLLRPRGSDRITEEERHRVLVIYEIARRIPVRIPASLEHGLRVVILILDDLYALAAQQILLPLPRVRGHVDLDFEPEECAHDAYREPQVSGRSDLHRVAAEEFSEIVIGEPLVIVLFGDHSRLESEVFGMLQNFVDASSGLDRAGDRQMAVHLQEKPSRYPAGTVFLYSRLHRADLGERRLDEALVLFGLREAFPDIRSKPVEPPCRVLDVFIGHDELAQRVDHVERKVFVVDPESLLLIGDVPEDPASCDEFLCVLLNSHLRLLLFKLPCSPCIIHPVQS